MKQRFLHRPGLDVKAQFSNEGDLDYRYRLEVTKQGAASRPRTVCAIMQNPSYAGEKVADKSVQVLERVVFEHNLNEFSGVERLVVVNLFAFIQTNDFVANDVMVGSRNDEAIEAAIEESEIVLIAWGASNSHLERQQYVLGLLGKHPEKRLLQTSRHPSRVIYDGFIQPFGT
jgi:hypothetical protein